MKALRSAMQKQRSGVLSRIATLCGLLFGAVRLYAYCTHGLRLRVVKIVMWKRRFVHQHSL